MPGNACIRWSPAIRDLSSENIVRVEPDSNRNSGATELSNWSKSADEAIPALLDGRLQQC